MLLVLASILFVGFLVHPEHAQKALSKKSRLRPACSFCGATQKASESRPRKSSMIVAGGQAYPAQPVQGQAAPVQAQAVPAQAYPAQAMPVAQQGYPAQTYPAQAMPVAQHNREGFIHPSIDIWCIRKSKDTKTQQSRQPTHLNKKRSPYIQTSEVPHIPKVKRFKQSKLPIQKIQTSEFGLLTPRAPVK